MTYKDELKSLLLKGLLGLVIGGIAWSSRGHHEGESIFMALLFVLLFAGLPYGWQLSGRVVGGFVVVGDIPIMLVALLVRFVIAILTGWIAYPIALVRCIFHARRGDYM